MMAYLILLLLSITSIVAQDDCQYRYDSKAYSRSTILTIKGLPTNLAFNPISKDILFTLIDLDTLQNDNVQTRMDQYILRNGQPIKIENVNGQAATVDVKNNRVYIASDDGLHILNSTDKASYISMKNEDIVQIYKTTHNDDLYVVMFPDNIVYKIDTRNNQKERVDDVPCAFILAVDSSDNIFYECDSKYVKVLLNGFHEPIEYVGLPKNSARAITIDENGRAILAANDGLYELKADNTIPKKLMTLDFMPSGITFADDDIYLSTNGVMFKYTNDNC